jgi:hypothetical protein
MGGGDADMSEGTAVGCVGYGVGERASGDRDDPAFFDALSECSGLVISTGSMCGP